MRHVKTCNVKSGKCLSDRWLGDNPNNCAEGIWFTAVEEMFCPQNLQTRTET